MVTIQCELQICYAAARANSKMTQAEWAEATGVSVPTVVNWEKGKSNPDYEQLKTMSVLSGIPMDFLCP